MLGGEDIVDTAYRGVVWRSVYSLRVCQGLLRYLTHDGDEAVNRVLALILRRLYHQTLMEEEREIDGRSMVAIVEETLSDIHRRDARRLVFQSVEDKLMLAETLDRQLVDILQTLLDLVGVESGERSHHAYVLPSESEDIGIGTQRDEEIAEESTDRA